MILTIIKSGLLKKILGLFGAAGFLMTFQACYGTPQNLYHTDGVITDAETNKGIPNLQVNCISDTDTVSVLTNQEGVFWATYINDTESVKLQIRDIDGEENGLYADYDTLLKTGNHDINLSLRKLNQ